MCENLDPNRLRCEPCRTINLAKHIKQPKPNMQVYEKCSPMHKFDCPRVTELPLHPTCIKVCTKEEYEARTCPGKVQVPKIGPVYAHGKLMYALKRKESTESLLAPAYAMYKSIVTTCFSGVVKVPLLVKCAYLDYLKAIEKMKDEEARERQIRKKSG
ncbi:uncharacterized protein LOC125055051 isoform X2 [Pieris napi]|uniref:uncharacterized protein LOC125055051 isoform X2 n=1 Tax=Pieris napi TaxID=78633 RepID=UPI001FB96386|nr:uncharacterized protein LOC125055051 isoform X2 [Pieris napi]